MGEKYESMHGAIISMISDLFGCGQAMDNADPRHVMIKQWYALKYKDHMNDHIDETVHNNRPV